MKLFPAIDLYNEQCVRLQKGEFNTRVVYASNPVDVAKQYESEGATWLHVIDLNGAETGENKNLNVIKKLCDETSLKIQVGGGIRSKEKVEELLNLGVTRVILGSYAINNLKEVESLIKQYPRQIIVSVDSRKGFVTYSGWQEDSNFTTIDFCKTLESIGVETVVYTDIAKDGMMAGPNFGDYEAIGNQTTLDIIASGGVSSYNDIRILNKMNLYGAIVGKALYINKVTVKEMIECLQEE